jgi:hypothetical protein
VFPIEDTDFTISASDSNGCFTSATIFLDVLPLPETPILELNNNTLSVTNNNSLWVDWYMNGDLLLSSTADSLEINTNGNFQVIVTNDNGCDAISEVMVVELTNVVHSLLSPIRWIYSNQQLLAPGEWNGTTFDVTLLDESGRMVMRKNHAVSPIDLPSDLQSGIYVLVFSNESVKGRNKIFLFH